MDNPLKYSDLIKSDNSITDAIAQLKELTTVFENMLKKVFGDAVTLKTALEKVTVATTEQQEAVKQAAINAEKLTKAQKDYEFAMSETAKQIRDLKAQQTEQLRTMKLMEAVNNAAAGSLDKVTAQYNLNTSVLKKMGVAEREGTESGKKLQAETNALYQEMKRLTEASGKHVLSVGDYAIAGEAVKKSFGELKRELKELRNTSFTGKSEIEIKGLNQKIGDTLDEMRNLKAMQTAMGEELGVVIAGSLKMIAAGVEGVVGSLSLLGVDSDVIAGLEKKMTSLIAVTQALGAIEEGMQRRTLQVAYARISAAIATGKDTAMKWLNTVASAANTSAEEARTVITGEASIATKGAAAAQWLWNTAVLAFPGTWIVIGITAVVAALGFFMFSSRAAAMETAKLNAELKTQAELQNLLSDEIEYQNGIAQARGASEAEMNKLEKKQLQQRLDGIRSQLEILGKYKKLNDDQIKQREDLWREEGKLMNQQIINSVKKGTIDKEDAKKAKELTDKQIEDAKKKKEAATKLAEDTLKKQQETNIKKLEDSGNYQIALAKLEVENAGSFDEKQKAEKKLFNLEQANQLQLLTVKKTYGQLSSNLYMAALVDQETAQKAFDKKQIKDKEDNNKQLTDKQKATNKESYDLALSAIEDTYTASLSDIEVLKATEAEKTRLELQAKKDRINAILALNESGNKQLSDAQIHALKNSLIAIDNELNKKTKKDRDIYDLLGIKFSSDDKENADAKKGISTAVSFAIGQVNDYMAARVKAADENVKNADREATATSTALDREIEARNNGYANNVETARKEFENAKKNQEKALAEQKKAQKAQAAIQTIEQTGNLITTSTEIWKSLAGIPIVGTGLALAALAVMWGSFIASKTKAAQLTKATYGKGNFEVMQGGSHASGNDIPLGIMPDGRQRTVEGGEGLGIFNVTSTRKYRKLLPDVVNSINKGIFESKYLKAFNHEGMSLNIVQSGANLKSLESDVKGIREQGEKAQYFVNAKGQTVRQYKNLTQIIS